MHSISPFTIDTISIAPTPRTRQGDAGLERPSKQNSAFMAWKKLHSILQNEAFPGATKHRRLRYYVDFTESSFIWE